MLLCFNMANQKLDKTLDEFEYALTYLLKIASDLRTLTSVSTEVLKRDDRERNIQIAVRSRFHAKAKAKRKLGMKQKVE